MALRRGYIVLILLALVLANCTRQASEPLEEIEVPGGDQGAPTSLPLQLPPGVSPTPTSLPVIISTPVPLPVSPTLPLPASETPSTTVPEVVPTTPAGGIETVPLYSPPPTGYLTPGQPPAGAVSTPTPRAIASATPLVTPTALDEGIVSDECIYIVQAGDTLFRIAINHGTSLQAITAANPLVNPEFIRPGDEIVLPDCGEEAVVEEGTPPGEEASADQVIHIVAAGETLSSIARRYGVTVAAIVEANNLLNPDQLSIGEELIIPPVEH